MRSVCVFAGSNPGNRPEYAEAAARLGAEIAARGLTLVYGGSNMGLMGRVANAALESGGRAVGVMPRELFRGEMRHAGLTEFHETADMRERKAKMASLADAFVALPGGYGTFEELFEAVSWLQLGIHAKPVGLVNTAGFYDPLVEFIRRASDAGFLPAAQTALLVVDEDPVRLMDRLAAFVPPPKTNKWVEMDGNNFKK
ncbi:LOG family protein [Paenibacillus alkalitolerans]|uniref:LOG family protein n=1 Tax=Paenibacillus alkalitolerans TaxID=2799335 RepID=UPI0018F6FA0E|nr:TIGR00730 family Rossman fold protein [Paenibacillus alkalitolerans]